MRRTDDDLHRYHNKIMIVDRATLYVLGFNYTALDVNKSRSFGLVTRNATLVREAIKLFEADSLRQPYTAGPKVPGQPGQRAGTAGHVPAGRAKAAAPLRSQAHRPHDDPHPSRTPGAGVSVRILGTLGKAGRA